MSVLARVTPELPRSARPAAAVAAAVALAVLLGPLTATAAAKVSARGGIDYAYVLGAKKGRKLARVDAAGRTVARGRADRLGSKIFRGLTPGRGYRVRVGRGTFTPAFRVLRAGDNPRPAFTAGSDLGRASTT